LYCFSPLFFILVLDTPRGNSSAVAPLSFLATLSSPQFCPFPSLHIWCLRPLQLTPVPKLATGAQCWTLPEPIQCRMPLCGPRSPFKWPPVRAMPREPVNVSLHSNGLQ
jgi:hypothetical protein